MGHLQQQEKKSHWVSSYHKFLQPKFVFEFGAIFCFKTYRIFGAYVLI